MWQEMLQSGTPIEKGLTLLKDGVIYANFTRNDGGQTITYNQVIRDNGYIEYGFESAVNGDNPYLLFSNQIDFSKYTSCEIEYSNNYTGGSTVLFFGNSSVKVYSESVPNRIKQNITIPINTTSALKIRVGGYVIGDKNIIKIYSLKLI